MVNAPDALVWSMVSRHNSFMKKRNGRTRRSGALCFSTEPCNLRSMSSFRDSGLANSKGLDVTSVAGEKGPVLKFSKKTVSKASTPAKSTQVTPLTTSSYRKAVASLSKQNVHYRADLEADLKAKYDRVANAIKVEKGTRKGYNVKTGRNGGESDDDAEDMD